ncbi:hypothetical protein HHL19_18610 [Streptomyces sp. R302]|uniref:hypothetical protein n=1 Tax=unclassified Streptomyces TaxID=2593676 RepID=UPI00145CE373|nr:MULTISPECIES: hypothetical protein [unclassified Streptomyces]NML54806.1 hypothetical protein [Streptomyces sp. R301]NML80625.1 hypothetical protein [Streptomyces sp. R302]
MSAIDISAVMGSALPATLTFLYQRLEAVLERRRSGRVAEPEADPQIPAELVGDLEMPLRINPDHLASRLPELEVLALAMVPYTRAPEQITAEDARLIEMLGRARAALEDVYGQRFTFRGEPREQSGPFSELFFDTVAGEVAGMEAQEAIRGSATSKIRAKSVEAGGKVVGMRAPVIEDRT